MFFVDPDKKTLSNKSLTEYDRKPTMLPSIAIKIVARTIKKKYFLKYFDQNHLTSKFVSREGIFFFIN